MKYTLLITLVTFLLVNLIITKLDLMSWLWFSTPVLIALAIEAAHFRKPEVSRAIPKTMTVLFPLGFLVFLSENFTTTTDGQAGLATALMPFYQLAIIILIFFAGLIKHVFKIETK